jgi:dsRNA-specific ribonuclease
MSYEETALRGSLTEEQLDRLVEAFVSDSDVAAIARRLNVPRQLVLDALENGALAERALRAKRNAWLVRFYGVAMDRLQTVLELGRKDTAETIAAIKLQRELLEGAAEAFGLPKPEPEKRPVGRPRKEIAEKKVVGSLAAALRELG